MVVPIVFDIRSLANAEGTYHSQSSKPKPNPTLPDLQEVDELKGLVNYGINYLQQGFSNWSDWFKLCLVTMNVLGIIQLIRHPTSDGVYGVCILMGLLMAFAMLHPRIVRFLLTQVAMPLLGTLGYRILVISSLRSVAYT
jgi:hypothetical protein